MPFTTRYGDDTGALSVRNEVLDLQLAHRSVRKFAAGAVTEDQLQAMVAAAQSASTSSNLQPWSVVVSATPLGRRGWRLRGRPAVHRAGAGAAGVDRRPEPGPSAGRACRGVCRRGGLPGDDDHRLRRHRPGGAERRGGRRVARARGRVRGRDAQPSRRGRRRARAAARTRWRPSASPSGSRTRPRTPASSRGCRRPRWSTRRGTTPRRPMRTSTTTTAGSRRTTGATGSRAAGASGC